MARTYYIFAIVIVLLCCFIYILYLYFSNAKSCNEPRDENTRENQTRDAGSNGLRRTNGKSGELTKNVKKASP